jgi:hypothetical protein
MTKEKYFTQDIIGTTILFNKYYFWMRDVDKTIYLIKAKENYGYSIDGNTGETTQFVESLEPDFS